MIVIIKSRYTNNLILYTSCNFKKFLIIAE
nr:MAG TPA: hypothetical protein [Caudoviricetes sp.]